MSALSRIEKAGFKVFLDGDNLGITPANNLTIPQRKFLKSHKAEIIAELRAERAVNEIIRNLVKCYSPNGLVYEVEATRAEHAAFLQIMNPKRLNYGE